MNKTLEDFIGKSRGAKTVDSLFAEYAGFMEALGFNRLAYAITSDHTQLKGDHALGITNITSLNDWDVYYEENKFIEIDPLGFETYVHPGIFRWDQYCRERVLSSAEKKLFQATSDVANLFHGSTFSVHGPGGTKGVAIACSDQKSLTFSRSAHDIANLATLQYHHCFLSLMQFKSKAAFHLTLKEQEVLKWAAKGLTKSDIGERLRVSSHTVDFHMRNIFAKLQVKNTASALVLAMQNGLIRL